MRCMAISPLVRPCYPPVKGLPVNLVLVGAVDSTIVTNVSLIEWIEVVPFEPFGSESNVSSYLQWAIPISNITVCNLEVLRFHAYAAVGRSGTKPSRCNPRILKQIPTTLWRCSICEWFPNVYFAFARPPLVTEVLLESSVPTKT